jgi:O-antigen/teichoic acid export membrane protein
MGTRFRSGIRQLLAGENMLACADQALVSAMSFATLILIGNWATLGELGSYAICSSFLALLLAAQDSLITRPYTIHLHTLHQSATDHASSALVLSLLLSLAAVLLITLPIGLFDPSNRSGLTPIAWAMAGAIPFVLMREFVRRRAFAHFRMANALALDAMVVLINILLLVWLGLSGNLSAATAISAQGISCGIGAAAWVYVWRREFAFGLVNLTDRFRQSWNLGKWLLASQLAIQAQGYTAQWLSVMIAGTAVTGIYVAALSVVGLANPALYGLLNSIAPKSARAFSAEGALGVRRQARHDALLLGAVMGTFCLALGLAGGEILHFLYPAAAGHRDLLLLLAIAALASALGVPASIALASADRAHAVAFITVVTAILNFGLILFFMPRWGLLGAACASVAAETLGSLGKWGALVILLPKPVESGIGQRGSEAVQTLTTGG